jgi:hypothetical protein
MLKGYHWWLEEVDVWKVPVVVH